MKGGEAMNISNKLIVDFSESDESKNWRVVNDGVMGGLSQGRIEITQNSTAIFQGKVSLENNGGFTSIHTIPRDYGLDNYEGLAVHIKGDGKTYQLRLRTEDRIDGISYHSNFQTVDGDWTNAELAFESFVPTFHGRIVPDAPKLAPGKIRQIGFLISDKQEGDFHLEIEWIKAYTNKKL